MVLFIYTKLQTVKKKRPKTTNERLQPLHLHPVRRLLARLLGLGPCALLQRVVAGGHLLLELLVGALAVEVLHPLAGTRLLEELAQALAGGGHLLAAGGAVLGRVFVQALPVLVAVAPALGALRLVRETHRSVG